MNLYILGFGTYPQLSTAVDYFVDKFTCLQLFSCLHEGFFQSGGE
jgi:hypothetical protein